MKRVSFKTISILAVLVLFIGFIVYYLGKPERVSIEFAENLFDYPLPNETTLIEKKQYNGRNWIDGGGSGGYWDVVAFMKLKTKLSKGEIVQYYKDAGAFTHANSNMRAVYIEVYFEDDRKWVEETEGAYYVTAGGSHQSVDNMNADEQTGVSNEVIVQIVSGFKFFQLD